MPRSLVGTVPITLAGSVCVLLLVHPESSPHRVALTPTTAALSAQTTASAEKVGISVADGSSIAWPTLFLVPTQNPPPATPAELMPADAPHISIVTSVTPPPSVIVRNSSPAEMPSPVTVQQVASSVEPDNPPAPPVDVAATPTPATVTPQPSATPAPPTPNSDAWNSLTSDLAQMAGASSGHVAISLVELGAGGQSWSYNGSDQMVAASTYKLPLLVAEAQAISKGSVSPSDQVCFQSDDWEDGYFQDYVDGACYTRDDLANRIGITSDNTAARMLVRDMGGTAALNAAALSYGASNSAFLDPNTTTANDLAAIWKAEYSGSFGGSAAQQWLFPKLTQTKYEDGVPAGVPQGVTVVHKIGEYDSAVNDAGLVQNGTKPYVLVVLTDSTGQGFAPIAEISARVWQYEGASSS